MEELQFLTLWDSDYPVLKRMSDQEIGGLVREVLRALYTNEEIDEDSLTNDQYSLYCCIQRNQKVLKRAKDAERQRAHRTSKKEKEQATTEAPKPKRTPLPDDLESRMARAQKRSEEAFARARERNNS